MSDQPTTVTTTAASPSASVSNTATGSPGQSDKNVMISSNIFIPIVAVIVGIFVVGAVTVFRRQIINILRKIVQLSPIPQTPLGHAENGQAPGQISAEQLAGGSLAGPGSGNAAPVAAVAVTGARGRRTRRGVRRTDSGASIRTLPAYSKEAGDEELVLVRRQSMGSVDELDEVEEGEDRTMEMRERRTSLSGVLDRVTSIRRSGSIRSIASAISRRSTRPLTDSMTTPPNAQSTVEQPTSPQSAPPRTRPLSQSNSVRTRGWGEAPTYLEAMSSPLPEVQTRQQQQREEDDNPPARVTLRERTSSTFLNLLSRTGLVPHPPNHAYADPYNTSQTRNPPSSSHARRPSSSVSLLLQPQTSRLSGRSSDPTTSAYPSPWTSTHSLGLISPPVLNSAVRASFETTDLPRAGLSEDQMRFLGTREATSLAGVRVGDVPSGKRRRGSGGVPGPRHASEGSRLSESSVEEEGSLPTWDELDGERRRAEADQGRNRAEVLLAGGVAVGTTTAAGSNVATSTSPHDDSATLTTNTPTLPTGSVMIAVSTPPAAVSTPPAPPPRLDIVAPTPTSGTFPTRLPIVAIS